MIFAVVGSQGSGKSTVLQALHERGYPVVDRKTARSILDDWGVTLDDVNEDLNLKMMFQDTLLERKISDDLQHVDDPQIWFTERTFADVFGYTVFNIGQYNQCSDWLDGYYKACTKAQNHYEGIFYLKGGLFKVEDDGVRGVNQHYSKSIDLVFNHFTHTMSSAPVFEIDFVDLQQRVDFIEEKAVNLARAAHGACL
jgi:predicted ATPase